jgi:hypothetical protein
MMNRLHSGLTGRFLPRMSPALGLADALADVAAVALTQAFLCGELWRRRDGEWRSVSHWARQEPAV